MNSDLPMKKLKDGRVQVTYKVDPCQGIAGMFSHATFDGYRLVSVSRKGAKAIVVYEKITTS